MWHSVSSSLFALKWQTFGVLYCLCCCVFTHVNSFLTHYYFCISACSSHLISYCCFIDFMHFYVTISTKNFLKFLLGHWFFFFFFFWHKCTGLLLFSTSDLEDRLTGKRNLSSWTWKTWILAWAGEETNKTMENKTVNIVD